jgi:putative ABC transport system substrate-binding protein
VKRRDFITLLGGAAVWPVAARAQQPERMRRIGVLMNLAADDVEGQRRLAAFLQGLQEAGWEVGRNVRIDIRSTGDIELNSKYAMELLALAPDVFLAAGAPTVRALQKATRTVPIVFTSSADRSVLGWSRVWDGRAAMLLAFPRLSTASVASGWNFSSRSHRP